MNLKAYLIASVMLLSIAHAEAQKKNRNEEAAVRDEIRQELADSIRNAQATNTQFTNNENIYRKALNIKFEVQDILINTDSLASDSATYSAIALEIPEAKSEDIKKEWSKYIKKKTKTKVTNDDSGIAIKGTYLEAISTSPINVYSHVNETPYGAKVVASFEEKDGFIAMGSGGKYNDVKGFMRKFAVEQYKATVKDQIKDQEKVMKDMEGDLSKLQRQNEKMHKQIKNNEQNIINTENDIKEKKLDQQRLINEMQTKKSTISSTKGEAKSVAEKELKDLEKEKKKSQNDVKSMNKKIVKYRAGIEETRREIELNLSEQDLQKQKISRQLSKVKSLEEKMASIK